MYGVSVNDYEQFSGFGAEQFDPTRGDEVTGREIGLEDLQKAMGAIGTGDGRGADALDPGHGSIQPAIVESLEATLKNLTLRRSELKIWRQFKTSPAYALAEEFLQLVDIGKERGGFHDEFDLPESEESQYRRSSEKVKYMGTTRAVSHQAQLVRTHLNDVVNREVENGTTWILRRLNRALVYGSARVVPQEFNGIYEQHGAYGQDKTWSSVNEYHDSELVVDMRGNPMTQEDFFDGAKTIDENHGFADAFYAPNQTIVDLAKDYISKQRILLNDQSSQVYGSIPKVITTPHGDIPLGIDKFLKPDPSRKTGDAATSPKAPADPTSVGTATPSDGLAKFADYDGDYWYGVAAVNRFGESKVVQVHGGAKVSVTAAQAVDLEFTAGSGQFAATGYVVYRSKKDPATDLADTPLYPIFKVSTAELAAGYDGADAGKIRDRNRFIPDTEQAFMWETGDQVSGFKQLAPLMKMNLARLDPTLRFMVLLYGTPQLYNHTRVVRFTNIGRFTGA